MKSKDELCVTQHCFLLCSLLVFPYRASQLHVFAQGQSWICRGHADNSCNAGMQEGAFNGLLKSGVGDSHNGHACDHGDNAADD